MEELKALTEKIVADGGTPWCIGLGSGAATGWPATDWVEDMMLRTQSPQVYDDWTSNKMKFNDKRVVEAIEAYGWFARNDAYVDGGAKAVASEGLGGTDGRNIGTKGFFDGAQFSQITQTQYRPAGAKRLHAPAPPIQQHRP